MASQLHRLLGATTAIPMLRKESCGIIYLQLTSRVYAQMKIEKDPSGGLYSVCAWCLTSSKPRKYSVSSTVFVADLVGKKKIHQRCYKPLHLHAFDLSFPGESIMYMREREREKDKQLQTQNVLLLAEFFPRAKYKDV